jgi:hypothetical protein
MDYRGRRSYLAPVMLRKLLALLVLVTGLAAIGQPAQALVGDVQSVRAAADAGYACAAQPGQRSAPSSLRRERDEAQPKSCPKPRRIVLVVPTVMLQADRAHE